MALATHAYISRCPGCRRIVIAAGDHGDADTAKYVAGMIRDGYTVKRVKVEIVRKAKFGCKCKGA